MTLAVSLYLARSNLSVILTGGVGKNGSSVAVSYLIAHYKINTHYLYFLGHQCFISCYSSDVSSRTCVYN